ncbi:MAG: hypothetical protein IPM71_14240 [Bacteroidota bacterium]|nr:MAG: hypothetical protein IPM71_14240 [Bacteroidota bacterium]
MNELTNKNILLLKFQVKPENTEEVQNFMDEPYTTDAVFNRLYQIDKTKGYEITFFHSAHQLKHLLNTAEKQHITELISKYLEGEPVFESYFLNKTLYHNPEVVGEINSFTFITSQVELKDETLNTEGNKLAAINLYKSEMGNEITISFFCN